MQENVLLPFSAHEIDALSWGKCLEPQADRKPMLNLDTPSPVLLSCHGRTRTATNRNGCVLKRGLDGPTVRPIPVLSCFLLPMHVIQVFARRRSRLRYVRGLFRGQSVTQLWESSSSAGAAEQRSGVYSGCLLQHDGTGQKPLRAWNWIAWGACRRRRRSCAGIQLALARSRPIEHIAAQDWNIRITHGEN